MTSEAPAPERLDRFMARANAAYYAGHDPFADFTTAPEITQMFGEVLCALMATIWAQIGSPDPVLLAEAGPGRGSLLADGLRALGPVAPGFVAAARLHLIEASPRLRAIQAQRLPGACFHDEVASLPDGPLLLIGNEFLDALPIRQFVRRGPTWYERFVADGRSVAVPAEPPARVSAMRVTEGMVPEGIVPEGIVPEGIVPEGIVVEECEAAHGVIDRLARRFVATPGVALFLDYGPGNSGPGETLQAIRGGRPADPLADPGSADLTAHVDFAALAATARAAGAASFGPVAQGALLERLGLFVRARRLAAGRTAAEALAVMRAAQRLAAPEHMGSLFKALLIASPDLAAPAGFEPCIRPA